MGLKDRAKSATGPEEPTATKTACAEGPIVVVIDPGHGDIFNRWLDPGVIYPTPFPKSGGFMEKDLALGVSKALKAALEKDPSLVKAAYLTREKDLDDKKRTRYKWRIAVAKDKDARVFVSIHLNSGSTSAHHIEYREDFEPTLSKELAAAINKDYSAIPAHRDSVRAHQLGVLALHRTAVKSGVLVELGCIGNEHDRSTLNDTPETVAAQIAAGIHAFIKKNLATLSCGSSQSQG